MSNFIMKKFQQSQQSEIKEMFRNHHDRTCWLRMFLYIISRPLQYLLINSNYFHFAELLVSEHQLQAPFIPSCSHSSMHSIIHVFIQSWVHPSINSFNKVCFKVALWALYTSTYHKGVINIHHKVTCDMNKFNKVLESDLIPFWFSGVAIDSRLGFIWEEAIRIHLQCAIKIWWGADQVSKHPC